ncbi:MAG: asparagine synthase-related protein [Thaumarchaeota archaeon]|jgi:asparagine synthase (glutamine-hydrolysing)|nr:asparagine synthase-related protein [Candidatus Geocrenenecus arthurdayi]
MKNSPSMFYLAVISRNKQREYEEIIDGKLEAFNFVAFHEKHLELGNDQVMLLCFSNPSVLDERSGGLVYVECYPDDLACVFEKIRLDISLKNLGEMLDSIDGFFTGFIVDNSRIIMFRDHVGAIPCNYRVDAGSFVATSFRKMIDGSVAHPPGRMIVWDSGLFKIHRWYRWRVFSGDYVVELKNRLIDVFSRCLPDSFSLSFSGGLDSVLIAYVASMLGRSIECITVGAEDSIDFQWAEDAAALLGLRLRKVKVDQKLVRDTVEVVSRYLVKPTVMDLSIASVFYLVATNSVYGYVVSGQGADELFGGYYKYVKIGREKGLGYVKGVMMKDILELHKTNIERDYLVVATTGKRLIQPYLAKKIYELALSTPVDLKISLEDDSGRKIILRRIGKMLGLQDQLIWKPKKALQYSSKIQKLASHLV